MPTSPLSKVIGTPNDLHPLQVSWMVHGGAQCGFCSPGFIVSAKALLDENSKPTREDVRDWFQSHRNACRCAGYKPLVDAVMDAARVIRGEISKKDSGLQASGGRQDLGRKIPASERSGQSDRDLRLRRGSGAQAPAGYPAIALVQAKVSHANILSIDTSEAEKMPGVYKVVTHKDVKGKNRITGLITFPTNKGDGWDRPILCDIKCSSSATPSP